MASPQGAKNEPVCVEVADDFVKKKRRRPSVKVIKKVFRKTGATCFMSTYIFMFSICAFDLNALSMESGMAVLAGGLLSAFLATMLSFIFEDLGDVNPVFVICDMTTGQVSVEEGIVFIGLQIAAAVLAVLTLIAIYPGEGTLEKLHIQRNTSQPLEALVGEFLIGFIISVTNYGIRLDLRPDMQMTDLQTFEERRTVEEHNAFRRNFAGLPCGMAAGLVGFLGGSSLGIAGLGPLRATAPGLLNWRPGSLWIFWLGDTVGGLVGCHLCYSYFAK